MTLAEQLRATADASKDRLVALGIEQETLEAVVASIEDALAVMRDGSSINADSASALLVDGAGAGGEKAGETSVASPSAPAQQPAPVVRPVARRTSSKAALVMPCPECARPFKAGGLGTHRRHVHGHTAVVRAPAPCPDCGKVIAHGQNLERHRQQVHGGEKRAGNGAPPPVVRKGGETFLCDRCTERFSSREALAVHRTSHPEAPRGKPVGNSGQYTPGLVRR